LVTYQKLYQDARSAKYKTYTGDTKKRELLKNPTKIEEIQKKIY